MSQGRGGRGSETTPSADPPVDGPMPDRSPLERRYRRWLLAYPADYRRERGDELVGTLLDLTAPGRTRPRPAEVLALLRGGVLRRCLDVWSPARRGRTSAALAFLVAGATTLLVTAADTIAPTPCTLINTDSSTASRCPSSGSLQIGLNSFDLVVMLAMVVTIACPILVRHWSVVVPTTLLFTAGAVWGVAGFGPYFVPALALSWFSLWSLPGERRSRAARVHT